MKYAVVNNNMVKNVIVADESQKTELEMALNAELIDAAPFGLQTGDLRRGGKWTRNQNGEQIVLDENATYDELVAKLTELEELLNDAN